jgi:cytochrome P450
MGAFITFLLSFQPLSIIIFFLFYLTLIEFRRVKKSVGTGPTTYPVIGCLISFYKNRFRLLSWYTELLAESPTNTILVQRLGARRTIITTNQQNVEYILKTNFKNFPKGKPFTEILGDFLGKGIFNVDGDLWMKQRKLASHEFSLRSINEFIMNTLEEEVNGKLLPFMDSLSIENKVVDFQELLGRFSFNVICKFTLGINDDNDTNRCCLDPCFPISPLARAFDVAAEISARRGAAPLFLVWRVKKWLGVGSEKRLREAVNEVKTRVMEIILERKKKMNVIGEKLDGDQDLLSRLISSGK